MVLILLQIICVNHVLLIVYSVNGTRLPIQLYVLNAHLHIISDNHNVLKHVQFPIISHQVHCV